MVQGASQGGQVAFARGDEVDTPRGRGVVASCESWTEVAQEFEDGIDRDLKIAEIRSHLGNDWQVIYRRTIVDLRSGETATLEYEPVKLAKSWMAIGGARGREG